MSTDAVEFAAPQLLSTNILDSAEEAIEAVHAADVLGLGVRLSNRLVQDEESEDVLVEEWVVEVYSTVPEVAEDPED
ncbi:hypothetical protein F0L68_11275 [Solihabitans fulvus]|uniref:Uncharacterized protein n=1 Tax=Solihabitans fulvus TaxID=1892852 RepID=A0A5B2XHE1_9PSEU|nr:hypothetical protein [Solihabitans fulvus]KAA2262813.1 hypothetical protein F0L68_11275 [Solihabitans fulvus]